MKPFPTKIIVLGGGTSGWLTAALLKKHHKENIEISLIAGKESRPIGVGEATVPTLADILKILEIPESDIFRACNGTIKLAIKFTHWRKDNASRSHSFYHPFGHMPKKGLLDLSEYWLQGHLLGLPQTFAGATSMIPSLCDFFKAPRTVEEPEFTGMVEYAYHLDAGLMGQYLKNYCLKLGVQFLETEIENVALDGADGSIKYLQSRDFGNLSADLYVDCSGFRSLMLGGALKEKFYSYQKSLPCDRALATNLIDDENTSHLNNYTTASALKSGWAWHIPLQTRAGVGYVYSSSHLSDAEAEAEFRLFLQDTASRLNFQKIVIRAGRHDRAWVKNCVAVGLAGGFVEPLESSGLAFIYTTVQALSPHVHQFKDSPQQVAAFNQYIGALYDLIRDFLILHYCTSDRDDTQFWRDCAHGLEISESLRAKLNLWKKRLPQEAENQNLVNFNNYNVLCILAGMEYLPREAKPGLAGMEQKEISAIVERMEQRANHFATHLPGHREWLNSFKG